MKEAMQSTIRPLGNRVLVKRLETEETLKGGIILPDSAKKKQEQAVVITLGTGGKDKNDHEIVFAVQPGDIVLIEKYAGQEVTVDSEEFIILKTDDIMAIIK
ncbi:10 kDa chaperonin [Candidatus Clavichlamydia salmonicola]|uniref:co-chaperone GroES n=1 Tax=Candidatus Clavichlamydia salmonicola TaxID=469812 RepID=UPI001891EFB0|nr:co-chaperone GroES [Candidatus Clavichlamydia salmonicola]MBF5051120.1 10 kDa chaperonin [Candidatus Clavichlamydia salmonicola]